MRISQAIYTLAGLLSELGDKEIFTYDVNGELVAMENIGIIQIRAEIGIKGILIAASHADIDKRIVRFAED
jgi:hypothetical protein